MDTNSVYRFNACTSIRDTYKEIYKDIYVGGGREIHLDSRNDVYPTPSYDSIASSRVPL